MNVLPFVAIFLTILATLSYSFLDKSKTLLYEKEVALSYMSVERKFLKNLHKEAFRKAPKKKTSEPTVVTPSSSFDTQLEIDPLLSPRGDSLSKMNLFPLFIENCPGEILTLSQNLFKILYDKAPFLESTTANETLKNLLKSVIAVGKEKIALCKEGNQELAALTLSDFYPKNQKEHALFYKILKGTHVYTLQNEGYPPLQDFFFFKEEQSPKVLHFPSLSPAMLEVVFGKEESLCILTKEIEIRTQSPKRALKTLSKEELISLLHEKFPSKTHFDKIIEYLAFSNDNKMEEVLSASDKKTSIKIQKPKII